MKAAVGSHNPVKVAATEAVLRSLYGEDVAVHALAVPSGVPAQPWGNEETLRGALRRAEDVRRIAGADLGIGFEGGVVEVSGQTFTCAWCAVARADGVMGVAGGENVLLPDPVTVALQAGMELGAAMDELTDLHDTKRGAGAIGLLTGGLLDRQSAYEHLLKLALARLLTPELYEG